MAPEEDYESYVLRGQQRFRRIVFSLLALLIAALFAPFALVPSVVKESTALSCTLVAGLLFLAVWRALLMKIRDPNDSPDPSPAGRARHLKQLLLVAGGCLAGIAVLAIASFVTGVVDKFGLGGYLGLCVFSGILLGNALLARGLSSVL